MAEMEDRWLSITEICKYLGVSNDTVYKWIDKHGMPALRMGRLWKLKKDEVDKWVKAGGAAEHHKKESGPKMSNNRYSMSFTTGSLFHQESVKLAELYLDLSDWNSVRNKVIAENLLQTRTLNTLKRVCREVVSRLKTLSSRELEFLIEANHQEQAYLLWLAVCRRYRFIADFAVEVLRERYITLKTDLTHEDFDSFFNRKSEWHLELDEIAPATRNKLRQVLFKILREADLLTANKLINAPMLSPRLLELIHQGSQMDILYFPVFESDLKGMAQ
jgi:excisionase family DNA binding protein